MPYFGVFVLTARGFYSCRNNAINHKLSKQQTTLQTPCGTTQDQEPLGFEHFFEKCKDLELSKKPKHQNGRSHVGTAQDLEEWVHAFFQECNKRRVFRRYTKTKQQWQTPCGPQSSGSGARSFWTTWGFSHLSNARKERVDHGAMGSGICLFVWCF